jgi:hypothetical protein
MDSNAPVGNAPLAFVSIGTSVSDAAGAPILFTTDDHNGVIHISGTAVPEPSSFVMALGSLSVWFAISIRARRAARALG